MDVELAEWGALARTDDEHMARIRQLVLEFHRLHDKEKHAEYLSVMEHLLQHFSIVHTHGNNCCEAAEFDEYSVPPYLEVTLVRKDLVNEQACVSTEFRPGLDAATVPKWEPSVVPVK